MGPYDNKRLSTVFCEKEKMSRVEVEKWRKRGRNWYNAR